MKLYYSPTSPFVRKVNVFAIELGIDNQLDRIKTNPWQTENNLTTENPLSKIPTLITDEGIVIYDSRLICEYLDFQHEGRHLISSQADERWQMLRLQALADGILDAGVLRFLEKKRQPEKQSSDWDNMQKNAIKRGLTYLENTVNEWTQTLNIGVISVACALGWLDFRFQDENWRDNRNELNQWFEQFSKRQSMLDTLPHE